ncbi:MAG: hypothetical protein H6656_19045 [Ardenticatenaceae bacterium]|nr:hypothetical protein [Ardenticatenaceae bacterium]
MNSTRELEPYTTLLLTFVNGQISASEFERQYLDLYLQDETIWSDDLFAMLEKLFGDVDAFVADLSLRDAGDLDEKQLRKSSQNTLEFLNNFMKNPEEGDE